MAYGQTGSGKTHTMLSSHTMTSDLDGEQCGPDEGVIPRSAKEIFRYVLTGEPFISYQSYLYYTIIQYLDMNKFYRRRFSFVLI